MENNYDAIVIGAGHAGVESAVALAKLNKRTLLLSLSLDAVSFMACNPNIGGTAKGHLVKEIDALGGVMGMIADKATIQTRMLNLANGPAVHSLRNQVDKNLYHRLMKQLVETTPNLTLLEGEAIELLTANNTITGVKTALGQTFTCGAVVLATGVYLDAEIIIGDFVRPTGPNGFMRSFGLAQNLLNLGLDIRRFKTGTPPRILSSSVNYDVLEPQHGDIGIPKFSYMTDGEVRNDHPCYLTYTNLTTHDIILSNLDRSPIYNGSIGGIGPRYCPSIETKVVRFKDKERHQIFIEPEGADTSEMYIQGLSTSLPFDIQDQMVHSVVGLENAVITRYGYAIEYDCINPTELSSTLGTKKIAGLYCAGQINGSSGYEEAGAQGLVAGINASLYLDKKTEVIFSRSNSYIGVLIDDLVTKGTNEPYRMMTSRAEHRLYLRQDNADIRLTPIGREIGLVDDTRYAVFESRQTELSKAKSLLSTGYSPKAVTPVFEAKNEPLPKAGITAKEILKRSSLSAQDLIAIDPQFSNFSYETMTRLEVELKYEGYLIKEEKAIREASKLENLRLPANLDYSKIEGLRLEAQQKLTEVAPLTLAQASRISGVTPADITVLLLRKGWKNK